MGNGKDSQRSEMVRGTLEMLILKTLERHRDPLHGYGIAQHIKQTSKEVLQVEEGSLYPALQRLALKNWVTAEWGVSETNRRARFYRLTKQGHRQLAQESADFERVLEAIMLIMQSA